MHHVAVSERSINWCEIRSVTGVVFLRTQHVHYRIKSWVMHLTLWVWPLKLIKKSVWAADLIHPKIQLQAIVYILLLSKRMLLNYWID